MSCGHTVALDNEMGDKNKQQTQRGAPSMAAIYLCRRRRRRRMLDGHTDVDLDVAHLHLVCRRSGGGG